MASVSSAIGRLSSPNFEASKVPLYAAQPRFPFYSFSFLFFLFFRSFFVSREQEAGIAGSQMQMQIIGWERTTTTVLANCRCSRRQFATCSNELEISRRRRKDLGES